MVCGKCQKKLGKVITPDVWKSGSRNTIGKWLDLLNSIYETKKNRLFSNRKWWTIN